jgi:hypothetical protein
LSSFPSSALGFGHQTLGRTFFLSSTCLSTSSCCYSWRRQWTILFWDLVKPSGHYCGLGILHFWLDPSSSNCSVRWRSGARHMISSLGTRELAISSSRLFASSLTRPPSRSWTLTLPASRSWTLALPPTDRGLRFVDCWIYGDPQLKVFCHWSKLS